MKAVKLGLPVLYKEILKFACDLAQAEMDKALNDEEEEDEDDKGSQKSYEFEEDKEQEKNDNGEKNAS